jgi:hypothetical protein
MNFQVWKCDIGFKVWSWKKMVKTNSADVWTSDA